MTALVTVTDDGPVRTIRMNRPEKKNALTMAMYDAMAEGIETAPAANIRCLLIGGAPTVFCAGNDIGDLSPGGDGRRPWCANPAISSRAGALRDTAGRGGPRQRGSASAPPC